MRPTRRDWAEVLIAVLALARTVTAAMDGDWSLALWAFIALGWVVSAFIYKKGLAEYKAAYLAAKARADRAQWGGHLS